jgi:hypothetical protein
MNVQVYSHKLLCKTVVHSVQNPGTAKQASTAMQVPNSNQVTGYRTMENHDKEYLRGP